MMSLLIKELLQAGGLLLVKKNRKSILKLTNTIKGYVNNDSPVRDVAHELDALDEAFKAGDEDEFNKIFNKRSRRFKS